MQLSIVLPCFNEEDVIEETNSRLLNLLHVWINRNQIDSYEIIYVDDGSRDDTLHKLKKMSINNQNIKIISLSGNFGHQSALTAGIDYAQGDAIVMLDADLQDPPYIIEEMVKKYNEGFDIIYGVRESRNDDTMFKKLTAKYYYKLLKLVRVDLISEHADFRLISKQVCNEFKRYNEVNRFLRGIFPIMGFNYAIIKYKRSKRHSGTTKYPLHKMIAFAIQGITSFSHLPLRLSTFVGLLVFISSLALSVWALLTKAFGYTVPGWASTVIPIYLFGGIQLVFIGIIGEYIGKIYLETKNRPIYIVKDTLNIK